jgi:hypothetical protein
VPATSGDAFCFHYQVNGNYYTPGGTGGVLAGGGVSWTALCANGNVTDEFNYTHPPPGPNWPLNPIAPACTSKLTKFSHPSELCFVSEPGDNEGSNAINGGRPVAPGIPDFSWFYVDGAAGMNNNRLAWLRVLPHLNTANGVFLDGHGGNFNAGFLGVYFNTTFPANAAPLPFSDTFNNAAHGG